MRTIGLLFFFISVFSFGQKKKNVLDVVSNADAKIILLKPLGNNTLAKDLQPFFGFGFGGNLMTPINFGVGVDVGVLFSNVKYGHENRYGSIGSPRMITLDAFITHRENISEEFFIEEFLGFSYFNLSQNFIYDKSNKYNISGSGPLLGGKAIMTMDREGAQQVFASVKASFMASDAFNENPEIQNYYRKSTFLSFAVGYRYNF